MEFTRDLFSDRFYLIVLLLVVMDVALVACFILLWKRRSSPPEGSQELKQSLQSLVDDMNGLAGTFAANLEGRAVIIQKMLKSLDEKIVQGESMLKRLQEAEGRVASQKPPPPLPTSMRSSEAGQVLALAAKGMDADAIARRLQKPLGEVELILNIQRLTREKL